ncbi:MAG: diguanylate cyclase [Selenomonadaceae bacterium]|nr:diguanylate cyclase [Selenomonadaceae bacterium]
MKKILIVDDMAVSLLMTENILSTQYEVVCASSGEEAMTVYEKEHPDMVLSDLRMPKMSGYELQLALQKKHREKIPFMFMTADQAEETESQGFDNGAMDFIRKPFRADVLLRRVANILQTVDRIQGLKKHATIDSLTGLLNKSSSEEELTKICKTTAGALMMIDLDSFKLVNDIHGHSMGDKILISFADIIKDALRPADIIGRMGGDEFIAFCHGMLDEHGVSVKSNFINENLVKSAKELMGEDMNIPLGASIGCVFVPKHGVDFAELYKKADKALYTVKQNGKHGYNIYNEETEPAAEEPAANISHIEMILGERNRAEGPLSLPFEGFRSVYRYLVRTLEIYEKPACILLLTLTRYGREETSRETAEEHFMDLLKTSLRRGDIITKNASNFIVLLTNIDGEYVDSVSERIQHKWEKLPDSKSYLYSYEWSILGNVED